MKIIIASSSENRKKLILQEFPNYAFEFIPPDYKEKEHKYCIIPILLALRNSHKKAISLKGRFPNNLIIAFDTVIYRNFKIYNKPADNITAQKMLKDLSGKKHKVVTGITSVKNNKIKHYINISIVKFKKLTYKDIEEYIALGESLHRAGGYAIQKNALKYLIEYYKGDYTNIIGAPIKTVKNIIAGA